MFCARIASKKQKYTRITYKISVPILSFYPIHFVKYYRFYIFAQMSVMCQIILFHVHRFLLPKIVYIDTECLESLKRTINVL